MDGCLPHTELSSIPNVIHRTKPIILQLLSDRSWDNELNTFCDVETVSINGSLKLGFLAATTPQWASTEVCGQPNSLDLFIFHVKSVLLLSFICKITFLT